MNTNPKYLIALIALAALMFRLILNLNFPESRDTRLCDQVVFQDMAKNIAEGRGMVLSRPLLDPPENPEPFEIYKFEHNPEFSRNRRLNAIWGVITPEQPTSFFPPLYPLFLTGLYKIAGNSLFFIRLVQACLDAILCLLVYLIGSKLFDTRTGILASAGVAFYPYLAYLSLGVITQTMFVFLLALGVYCFLLLKDRPSPGRAALFGLCWALAFLTNPMILLYFPVAVVLAIWGQGKKAGIRTACVALLTFAAVVSPWTVRNHKVQGQFLLLPTKGGRNLWEANNQKFSSEVLWKKPMGVERWYASIRQRELPSIKRSDLIEFPDFTTEPEIERDRILKDRVTNFLIANPRVALQFMVVRFVGFFRPFPSSYSGIVYQLAGWLSFGVVLPLAIAGIVVSRQQWKSLLIFYGLLLYFTGVHTAMTSGIPHRIPIDPYLILFGSYSATQFITSLKKRSLWGKNGWSARLANGSEN